MTLKTKFLILTLVLALGTTAIGLLTIRWYNGYFPSLHRAAPALVQAIALDKSPSLYYGLKPTPTSPNGVYYRDRVLVLMYHDVSPEPQDSKSLSVANFEKQLQLMQANNFKWITMDEYRDFILHSAPVPDNAVLLTFDDGYESLYSHAYPLMKQYEAPSAAFLIAGKVGDRKGAFPKATWEQVKEMQQGGIDFFSHTYDSHRYMPTAPDNEELKPVLAKPRYLKKENRLETEEEYEKRVYEDLRQANEILQRELGRTNYALAFPYGAFSETVLDVCKRLGIDVTFTVRPGLNAAGQTNGYRLNAGGADNDPDLQIELMKKAEKRLDGTFSPFLSPAERKSVFLISAAAWLLVGLLWVWTGWRLLQGRKRSAGL
ncbi:polysaccharide deacetylase family protein [Cohnella hongkongensis]|uniref:Polysaccharide deacetylase family protein n=1 Tax=Cohnella hongkongensis TaxID=178337 RepID=A0ABV9FER4_9BACL